MILKKHVLLSHWPWTFLEPARLITIQYASACLTQIVERANQEQPSTKHGPYFVKADDGLVVDCKFFCAAV